MRLCNGLRFVVGGWTHTTLGEIPSADFRQYVTGAPTPRLLEMALSLRNGSATLIRLRERKYHELSDSNLDRLLATSSVSTSYGYELNGIGIPDLLVNTLTVWAIELYKERVVLAANTDEIFRINPK